MPGVILEVAGHAYHWSPEQRRYDEERRNRLTLGGNVVLAYTWRDITADPLRVLDEIREALAKATNTTATNDTNDTAGADHRSPMAIGTARS